MIKKKVKHYYKEAKFFKRRGIFGMALVRFLLSQTPLKIISKTELYKNMYRKRIDKLGNKIKPIDIQVEVTSFCNTNCYMCPHETMKRKKGIMEFQTFKKIVDESLEFSPRRIILSGMGEPLMDKDIDKKIKYTKDKGLYVKLITNGGLLDSKKINVILDNKVDEVNISVNAPNGIVHKKVTSNVDYAKLKENISLLMEEKKKRKLKDPIVNVSMIENEFNKGMGNKFIKEWVDIVDSVTVRPEENWGYFKESKLKREKYPCHYPFYWLTILWNGDVVPCCMDYEGKIIFGNVNENKLIEIWENEKYKKFRENQLNNVFLGICKDCNTNEFNPFMWWQ